LEERIELEEGRRLSWNVFKTVRGGGEGGKQASEEKSQGSIIEKVEKKDEKKIYPNSEKKEKKMSLWRMR